MKDNVFQEDCFELDHGVLPTEIFKSSRHRDLAHSNLLVFRVIFVFLQQMNQTHLFIEVTVCRGPQKLSVQCESHKNNHVLEYSPNWSYSLLKDIFGLNS